MVEVVNQTAHGACFPRWAVQTVWLMSERSQLHFPEEDGACVTEVLDDTNCEAEVRSGSSHGVDLDVVIWAGFVPWS